jgi:hypothetical protein
VAILKALTSGGERRALDFYPTPPEATIALLDEIAAVIPSPPAVIWEPACGDGAISKVLIAHGFVVAETDIAARGRPSQQIDFLAVQKRLADVIITNPPFNLAREFITHADELGVRKMAMLLKSNFWNVASNVVLFKRWTPAFILPLTWRIDFTGAGRPHTDCTWTYWDRDLAPLAMTKPLQKPKITDLLK